MSNDAITAALADISAARVRQDAAQAATAAAHEARVAAAAAALRAAEAAADAERAAIAAEAAEAVEIDAAQATIAAAEERIRAANAPAPAPAPPLAPAPEPPPAPSIAGTFHVTTEPVPLHDVLLFESQHYSSRYERYLRKQFIIGSVLLKFRQFNLASGGALLPLQSGVYRLLVDGEPRAEVEVTGGTSATFAVSEAAMHPGWRRVQIQSPFGVRSPSWFVHVGATRVDDVVPVCTGSYDWVHHGAVHRWAWVPADAAPLPQRRVPRECPPAGEVLSPSQLFMSTIVPDTGMRRINVGVGGVRSTFNRMAYFYSDLVKRLPPLPLLDGPPGVGTLCMPTHIEPGRATLQPVNGSPRIGANYVLDSWRLMRVNADGAIRTLVGYRHKPTPASWQEKDQGLDLVGDWSAIPLDRRGLHEAWDFVFDPDSLGTDLTAAPDAEGRQRHIGNPIGFIADTQNDRVLRIEFDGGSHTAPAKVTEFISAKDPFGVRIWRDELIVSERLEHRLAAYDKQTGAFKRVILQGQPLATVDVNRKVLMAGTMDQRRAAPCVAPEGIALLGDWLYFSSLAQKQVRRVHLVTGELQVIGEIPTDSNSRFVKIAVSAGQFFPAGTVFATTWSTAQFGYPSVLLPDGRAASVARNTGTALAVGKGPYFKSLDYAAAVAVADGELLLGTSMFGLHRISRALPTDRTIDVALFSRGKAALDPLLFGTNGHSPFGLPLPWGQSEDVDYFLKACGHLKPG